MSSLKNLRNISVLLPEIPLQQPLKAFSVPGFVAGHLWGYAPQGMHGVVEIMNR